MTHFILRLAVLALGTLLAVGCASHHITPPPGYAHDPAPAGAHADGVFRIGFDQVGDPLPRDPDTTWPEDRFAGDRHFRAADQIAGYDRAAAIATMRAQIRQKLASGRYDAVIIQIHGVNYNFTWGSRFNERLREQIAEQRPDLQPLIVEVYWDAMRMGTVSALFEPYWYQAWSYSNLAGQYGLRELLRAVPEPYPIFVITHSRGAAVAMAAIANPVYVPASEPYHPSRPAPQTDSGFQDAALLRRLRLAMVAPAIGSRTHILPLVESLRQRDDLRGSDFRLILVYNDDDSALANSDEPYGFFSTALGTMQADRDDARRMLAPYLDVAPGDGNQFVEIDVDTGDKHRAGYYFRRPEFPRVLDFIQSTDGRQRAGNPVQPSSP